MRTTLGLLLALSLCSCKSASAVRGSGVNKTAQRSVGEFSAIEVSGALRCDVSTGPSAVEVSGDDNLVPLVETEVSGGTLHVGMRDAVSFSSGSLPLVVRITSPTLTSASTSGAVHTTISGVHGDQFVARTNGAGSIRLQGSAAHVELAANGAAEIDASQLATDAATVDASGASHVDVAAAKQLDLHISGASHVRYAGHPAITQDISGASSAEPM